MHLLESERLSLDLFSSIRLIESNLDLGRVVREPSSIRGRSPSANRFSYIHLVNARTPECDILHSMCEIHEGMSTHSQRFDGL